MIPIGRRRRHPGLRTVLGLVTAIVMTGSLAACTPSPEHGVLVILAGRDDSIGGQRQALVDKWNFSHPDTPARVVELSGLADQQHDALVEDAQSEDSDVDVYGLDVTWTAEFAQNGYVEPIDGDVDTNDFLPGPLATARADGAPEGTLYGLPYNTDAGLLYYRTDVVPEPTSWSDLRDDADRLRTLPPPRPAAVYAGQLAPYEGLTVNVLEALRAVDPNQPDLFAGRPDALGRAVDLLRPNPQGNPSVVLPEALTFDEDASLQAFRQGRVAVLREWPVAERILTAPSAENPSAASAVGVTQLPEGGTVLGGTNLAVSAHTDLPVAAQELVAFLTNTRAQTQLFDEGGIAPTRTSAFLGSARAGDRFTREVQRAVASATPRPAGPCYGAFSTLFSAEIHTSLVDGTPVPADLRDRARRALDCKPIG